MMCSLGNPITYIILFGGLMTIPSQFIILYDCSLNWIMIKLLIQYNACHGHKAKAIYTVKFIFNDLIIHHNLQGTVLSLSCKLNPCYYAMCMLF